MLQITASRSNKLVSNDQESLVGNTDASVRTASEHKRILLVEDNDLNRQMLDDYLGYCGYNVKSLAKGTDFFQALVEFQPQLILLDLRLPDIDGYTLLERIQKTNEWQHIPVIVVSAFAFNTDQQRALGLGAKRYFVKPVNLAELTQAIKEQLTCIDN